MIIAGSFVIISSLGIVITIAVAFNEIPQELGDFEVLVYRGFSKIEALLWNFISGLAAILSGIFGFHLAGWFESIVIYFYILRQEISFISLTLPKNEFL